MTTDNIWVTLASVTDLMAADVMNSSADGSVNGTGWIPVNLTAIASGAPLSNWPLDPVNAHAGASVDATVTEDALMYVYDCDETTAGGPFYEVNANLESARYEANEASDGGNNANIYEIGTLLTIIAAWTA
jgi:hypothetical protein